MANEIIINLAEQTLTLAGDSPRQWRVSTAAKGAGEVLDSYQTPRGMHRIHAKIGEGASPGTVFVGRRPTGEIYNPELARDHPERDWILTRILWLEGCEEGRNKGGKCDTLSRFIYIHGAPDAVPMGSPGSIGCIRMRNRDVVELFDLVSVGTPVNIVED